MRKETNLTTRALALLLSIVLVLGMVPVTASAEESDYGTVESISEGGIVEGSNADQSVVTFRDLELEWVAADTDVGRDQDGWWVGIKVTAPEDMTQRNDFVAGRPWERSVTYQVYSGGEWSSDNTKSFWENQDSDSDERNTARYITLWGLITEDYLEQFNKQEKATMNYKWRFDWDRDGSYEHEVTLSIEPDSVILKKDGVTVYPEAAVGYGTLTPLTPGMEITGNTTEKVTIAHITETIFEWVAEDDNVGRYQDGWWAGVQINAPAGLTVEQLREVRYTSGNSAAKSFWSLKDSDDDADSHYLTMWVPLNNVQNGDMSPYTWKFDWNYDGYYEQVVTLDIVEEYIVLLQDGVQVYPTLGTVTPQTGGTVVGDGTGEVSVTIEEMSIDWSPENTGIGRYGNYWWVGIQVDAPEGMTADELQDAVYQSNNGAGWSADKPFWSGKDSADNAESHYIGLWFPVTPAILKSFQDQGRDITYTYQFDWDGDKDFEQLITLVLVPSDKIELKAKEYSNFAFDDPAPVNQWIGETFTNKASGGELETAVTYEVIDGTDVATVNPVSGELTFLQPGTVTVQATKAGDADGYYKDTSIQYTVTGVLKEQALNFETSTVTLTYAENLTYTNPLVGVLADADDTSYSIVQKESDSGVITLDPDTGMVTVLKAGTVVIQAYNKGNAFYDEAKAEYTLTIEKAEQSIITFEDYETNLIWQEELLELPGVTASESTGDVVYKITAGMDVAKLTEDGKLRLLKAGDFTISAYRMGDACYNDSKTIEIQIHVDLAPQSFVFAETDTVEVYYGTTLYNNPVDYGNAAHGTGELTYAISENDIGAVIDAEGNISFVDSDAKVGTVTVTVSKAADECYAGCSASYTLTVKYLETPAAAFTLSPVDGENGWYRNDVIISAAANYEISADNELSTDDWSAALTYATEGTTSPVVYLKNEDGHMTDAIPVGEIKLDKGDPENLSISYTEPTVLEQLLYFFNAEMTVTLSATDDHSGVASFAYSSDGENYTVVEAVNGSYSFKVQPQFRGKFSMKVTDIAGNEIELPNDGSTVVVDTAPPVIEAEPHDVYEVRENGVLWTKDEDFRIIFTVSDANYDLRASDPVLTINGETQQISWEEQNGAGVARLPLPDDGDYKITVDFGDRLHTTTYTMDVRVDKTAPVIDVDYSNTDVKQTVDGRNYYAAAQDATITITEHNFLAENVVVTVEADADVMDYTAYAKLDSNWTHNGDTHTLVLPFTVDANYKLRIDCTDALDNAAETYTAQYTVDNDDPVDLTVEYSKGLLEELTNGFYKEDATVTLSASDAVAGVDYFTVNVTTEGSAGATDVELPKDLVISKDGEIISGTRGFVGEVTATVENGTVSLSFQVPAQFRGAINFTATDRSRNTSDAYIDEKVVIVDTIAPGRTVTFQPTNVVSLETMMDVESYAEGEQVVLYYNEDALITFEITEANFYASDVTVQVNGQNAVLGSWTNTEGDTWQNTLRLTAEGDYVITVTYVDRSTNEMVPYQSQRIVIDKTAPVINVNYANNNVQNTIEGRDYYDATQTATITITEHNFRADDVVVMVTAQDVLGANVLTLNSDGTVASYANQGTDRGAWSTFQEGTWRRQDDTYVLELTFSTDANYTFDVAYQDMATNDAANYTMDLFAVDKTAPENLTISYSNSVLQQILETVTFGFYDAEVTVTVTATDDTTPIHSFVYSYINSQGVSSVNAQLLNQAIQSAQITYEGNMATATFTVPMSLDSSHQFNGNVRFTAYDRSGNGEDLSDGRRIVVDNISPVATISYNAPVKEANDISYYAGSIRATIVIDEANFYDEDVVVTVTKDGESYPVTVTWTDDSVDVHTGTFTLTEEGDYIVSVDYRDRSGNVMSSYVSNELTLDATLPVIQVSDVVNNSANNDEEYGFTITISDTNLDPETMMPVLTAVVKGEDGIYTTEQIDLGDAVMVAEGQTYTYTVENLTADAIYTMTCSVQDMSGNVYNQIVLEDGEAYETVQFSINRLGSTFSYGDDFTEDLVNQYYVYSVGEDVVVVEINVDPIEEYSVTLNGRELTEGTDYTTTQTSAEGEWSKRTYTISKDLFAEEGEYSIIVSSTDKTNSTVYSDVRDLNVAFVVDRTAPVITISGLETGGRYQTEEQTVTLIPSDEGGRLSSLKVVVSDANGDPLTDEAGNDISVRFDLSGEELQTYLEEHDGMITFTIPSGLNNQVRIVCSDSAVGEANATNEYDETFTRVTVSQNQFVIFYADTPLFFGTIFGVLALLIFIILLIKRKKDEEAKNKAKAKV